MTEIPNGRVHLVGQAGKPQFANFETVFYGPQVMVVPSPSGAPIFCQFGTQKREEIALKLMCGRELGPAEALALADEFLTLVSQKASPESANP